MKIFNTLVEFFNFEISFLVCLKIIFIIIIIILNIILFFELDTKLHNKVNYISSGFNNRILSNLLGKAGLGYTFYGSYLAYRSENYKSISRDSILNRAEENINKLKNDVSLLQKAANECNDINTKEFLNNGVNSFSKFISMNLELFNLQKNRDQLIEANGISKFEAEISKLEVDTKYILYSTLYLLRDMKLDWKEYSKKYPEGFDSKLFSEITINIYQIEQIIINTVPGAFNTNMNNKPSTSLENTDIDPKLSFIFSGFLDSFEKLDTMGKLAIALLFSKSLLLSSFISIIFIYYGDNLISKYKLDIKYPKLAAVINLRKKFTKYYLISNWLTIFFVILSEIIFSIAVLS